MRWVLPIFAATLALASCVDPGGGLASATPQAVKPATVRVTDMPGRAVRKGAMKSITFEEFFALHQSGEILVFDARPAFFYNLGHIPGAINLPRGTSGDSVRMRDGQFRKALADGKTIVTYCTGTTCPDARRLAETISALGHPVSIFSAGWHAWTDAEMPGE